MKYILFALLMTYCFISKAQTAKCKPQVHANKNKAMYYQGMNIRYKSWKYGYMLVTNKEDSIVVTSGETLIAAFSFNNRPFPGSKIIQYHDNGLISQMDSISYNPGWKWKRYWGCCEERVVYTRHYYFNGMPQEFVYFHKKDGEDSLRKKWYPTGILKEMIWYNSSGYELKKKTWNDDGTLKSFKSPWLEQEYYPTGAIAWLRKDTLIDKTRHTTIKTYYPAGTLKTVKYYEDDFSTITKPWLYYTENGVLERTSQNASVFEVLAPTILKAAELDICGYPIYSDIDPHFQGLPKYLNEKLADVLCKSTQRLAGVYEIKITIDFDGQAIFENITGENHVSIQENVKEIIHQMPKWKPGEMNGYTTKVALTLKFIMKNMN